MPRTLTSYFQSQQAYCHIVHLDDFCAIMEHLPASNWSLANMWPYMHKPPICRKLSTLRFCTVAFPDLCWSSWCNCFQISTAVPELWALESNYYSYSTCEVEKTKFTSFPYTNSPGFSERSTRPNLCQMLKEAMMLLSVTPCHVVEVRLLQWSLL